MVWGTCRKCGKSGFSRENCKCKRFLCWVEEEEAGDELYAESIYADDADDAAESFVEKYQRDCSGDYDDMDVWIQQEGSDYEPQRFSVSVELIPHYYAYK